MQRTKKRKRNTSNKQYDIQNIQDLIDFTFTYTGSHVDLYRLDDITDPLQELDNMIGLESLKRSLLDLILYFVQGYHRKNVDYLNMMICGLPGSGKTTVCHILSKILAGLGVVSTDKVTIVKRTDLIGQYIGQSSHMAKDFLNNCLGGVIFIDEAYSLAPRDSNRDYFAKEALDYLNGFLSEHKEDVVCIIAGYEDELEQTFFAMNPGLKRRFPWKFVIEPYTPVELLAIFNTLLGDAGFKVQDGIIDKDFFATNKKYFTCSGGDIETFITKCKFIHTRSTFGLRKSNIFKKQVIIDGLAEHKKHKDIATNEPPMGMYT